MKKGGYPKGASGFTIIETLIVLAVSGLLLFAAITLISGRANKTQFMTAANDLKQSLEQVINEAATGYFPNTGSFKCTAMVGTMPKLLDGAQQQGTNGDCIFLGKAVQFGSTDYTTGFLVYSIAGNRLQAGTQTEVTALSQAYPEAVAPGNTNNPSGLTGITIQTPLQNGLTAAKMTYSGGNTAGFAFLSTFANYTSATGVDCKGVCSGAQALKLYAVRTTSINGQDRKAFADVLDDFNNYIPASTVTACLNSATTNQSAVYTIGGNGDNKSVTMQIQSGAC